MMKYVVGILIFVAALAGFLLYLGEAPILKLSSSGGTRTFLDFEGTLSWQAVIVIFVLTLMIFAALWSLLGWLTRLPKHLKSGAGLRKRTQALEALEEALISGAQGDANRARRKSERARDLISSPALGQIISALSAEASGDREEAVKHYTDMLSTPRTRMTGQRGLAQQYVENGDFAGAIEYATQAYTDNKQARWAFDILFKAQVMDGRWMDAVDTLNQGERRKHIEKEPARRRRIALITAEADRLSHTGETALAKTTLSGAVSDGYDFAPAMALAARLYIQGGEAKKAVHLIEKAWARAPHPALALAFHDIISADTPRMRAKRVAALLKTNPDHRESLIFSIEENLTREDGVAAWSTLSTLVENHTVTARLCALAAQCEDMLGNQSDARIWLERASTAPVEADWSDLDPEGDAFEYTQDDWRRLIMSFGDKGMLIHPRFESGAPRKPVTLFKKQAETPPNETEASAPTQSEADSGFEPPIDNNKKIDSRKKDDTLKSAQSVVPDADADDLAERLDSLLGDDTP